MLCLLQWTCLSGVSSAKVLTYKNYVSCKKKALKLSKDVSGKGSQLGSELGNESASGSVQAMLSNCRKDYPASMLLAKCKRKLVKLPKGKKRKEQIKTCRKLNELLSSSRDDLLPFVNYESELYIDGLDFTKPYPFSWIEESGMDCSGLKRAIRDPFYAKYIFYGTELSRLNIKSPKFLKKGKAVNKNTRQIDNLMQVSTTGDRKIVYFPSERCDYKKSSSNAIEAISMFFLIDYKNELIYPYTTIVFFSRSQNPDVDGLTRLSENRSFGALSVSVKKEEKVFLSKDNITSFDDDDDPSNICSIGSPVIVGLIGSVENGDSVETAVLTTRDSYCSYMRSIVKQLKKL